MMLELDPAPRFAEGAERVDVTIARAIPVAKLDPELERRPGGAHELRLVEAEHVIELLDMRQGGFADANDANLIRFDQYDAVKVTRKTVNQGGRGHPPGRATAQDHDAEFGPWIYH